MKKSLLSIASALLLFSCSEPSKKGAWNQTDRDRFNSEMKAIDDELDVFGEYKQAFIDCYYDKVVNAYDNFRDADSDEDGCAILATQCATDLLE